MSCKLGDERDTVTYSLGMLAGGALTHTMEEGRRRGGPAEGGRRTEGARGFRTGSRARSPLVL